MVNISTYQNTKSIQTLISRQNFTEPRPLAREEFYIEGATFDLESMRKQRKNLSKMKKIVFYFVLDKIITNYYFSYFFRVAPDFKALFWHGTIQTTFWFDRRFCQGMKPLLLFGMSCVIICNEVSENINKVCRRFCRNDRRYIFQCQNMISHRGTCHMHVDPLYRKSLSEQSNV